MEDKKILCRYFLHGACSRGNACKFSHDLNAKKDNTCTFYLAGSCMYGNKCRYDHVKPVTDVKPTTDHAKPAVKCTNDYVRLPVDTVKTNTRPAVTTKSTDDKKTIIPSNFVILRKKSEIDAERKENWVIAHEFVPGKKSHVSATDQQEEQILPGTNFSENTPYSSVAALHIDIQEETVEDRHEIMCPYAVMRDCPYGESCEYIHGDICDICGLQCLHPTDQEQRKAHKIECEAYIEKEMNIAFGTQRSKDVTCSICLEIVVDKRNMAERFFGLLESCDHPFCLPCIRNWRTSSNQEKDVVRSCPICRVNSWYVTPSQYWIDDPKEKQSVIDNYKSYLRTKPCRSFDEGRGVCRFGTSCFYKHALPGGKTDDTKTVIRYREDAEGISAAVKPARLNEFIESRDG